jgi:hypothetical protein
MRCLSGAGHVGSAGDAGLGKRTGIGQRITCSLSVGKFDFDPQKTAGHLIFFVVGSDGR